MRVAARVGARDSSARLSSGCPCGRLKAKKKKDRAAKRAAEEEALEQGLDPSQMFYDKAEARFVEVGTPGSGSSMTKMPPNTKLPPLGNDASGALSGASSFDVNGPVKEISEKDRAERKKAEVKAQKAEAKAQKAEAKAQRAEAKVQKAEAEAKAKADDEDDEKQRKKRERRKAREQKKQSNVFTRWWKRNMEYEEVPLSMPAAKLAVKGLGLSNKQLLNMRERSTRSTLTARRAERRRAPRVHGREGEPHHGRLLQAHRRRRRRNIS